MTMVRQRAGWPAAVPGPVVDFMNEVDDFAASLAWAAESEWELQLIGCRGSRLLATHLRTPRCNQLRLFVMEGRLRWADLNLSIFGTT